MNRTAAYLISPDDPRITAFALGELEGDEHALIAAAVAQRPELQSAVDEIRRAADELTAALASEPLPEIDALPVLAGVNGHGSGRAAAHAVGSLDNLIPFPTPPAAVPKPRVNGSHPAAAPAASVRDTVPVAPKTPSYAERSAAARRRREPRLSYFWVLTLSAACFMLVVFVGERRFSAEEEAAAAHAAQIAATERARAAAAATRTPLVEIDLRDGIYARATVPPRTESTVSERAATAYLPAEHRPTSSFPIDVATTSYGDVVRAIAAKQLPPAGAVRIEEMLNTFAYDYPEPAADDEAPFAASLESADTPWARGHVLVRIGLKGRSNTGGAFTTIARNVSIQVQFNPETVSAYRLIGYEKSPLVAQDTLSAGRVDAAEVHAGHTVTALYEVIPVRDLAAPPRGSIGSDDTPAPVTRLLTVRIAYTRPDGVAARPLEFPLDDRGASFGDASGDFKFAAAVAGFGMKLREPGMSGQISFGSIIAWAEQGAINDRTGRRQEFVGLVRDASMMAR
jgi:hypothetical protein